jgi:hypothetical protein
MPAAGEINHEDTKTRRKTNAKSYEPQISQIAQIWEEADEPFLNLYCYSSNSSHREKIFEQRHPVHPVHPCQFSVWIAQDRFSRDEQDAQDEEPPVAPNENL